MNSAFITVAGALLLGCSSAPSGPVPLTDETFAKHDEAVHRFQRLQQRDAGEASLPTPPCADLCRHSDDACITAADLCALRDARCGTAAKGCRWTQSLLPRACRHCQRSAL